MTWSQLLSKGATVASLLALLSLAIGSDWIDDVSSLVDQLLSSF